MLGPHVLERTEYLHAALARAGLTGTELVAAARVLANFVIGNAVVESSRPLLGADPDREGLPPQAHVADQGRYPTLVQVGHFAQEEVHPDRIFELGLDMALTGVAARR